MQQHLSDALQSLLPRELLTITVDYLTLTEYQTVRATTFDGVDPNQANPPSEFVSYCSTQWLPSVPRADDGSAFSQEHLISKHPQLLARPPNVPLFLLRAALISPGFESRDPIDRDFSEDHSYYFATASEIAMTTLADTQTRDTRAAEDDHEQKNMTRLRARLPKGCTLNLVFGTPMMLHRPPIEKPSPSPPVTTVAVADTKSLEQKSSKECE